MLFAIRNGNLCFIAFIVSACLLPARQSSFAAGSLTSLSDPVFGPNSLTLDTATGLTWLDWSLTTNRAVSDIATQFGPAGQFRGFRYATKNELIKLYGDAGFQNLDVFDLGTTVDFQAAKDFVALFGSTRQYNDASVQLNQSRAFLGPGSYGLAGYQVEAVVSTEARSARGFAGANGGLVDPVGIGNGPTPDAGSALVRIIPEPASGALIVCAMVISFGLFGRNASRMLRRDA